MKTILLAIAAVTSFLAAFGANIMPSPDSPTPSATSQSKIKILKDVGEAYMDNFGLTESDFKNIKDAGFDVIEGNFDICANDGDVNYLLNNANKYGIKVVMPAGSGEAEWGYKCNQETFPKTQQPVWQKEEVTKWVNKWKGRPEIYAWDISNEAGSVFPNARWMNDESATIPDVFYIDKDQLKLAHNDVKAADPSRPIMIRMNGWFFYDDINGRDPNPKDFFRAGNPFDKGVADIVMVNAYSNVSDYYSDFVPTVTKRSQNSIRQIDPKAGIIISLGAWEEKPLWHLPKVENLQNEMDYLKKMDILGVAYFKYGAKNSEWYLPDSNLGGPEIWKTISD